MRPGDVPGDNNALRRFASGLGDLDDSVEDSFRSQQQERPTSPGRPNPLLASGSGGGNDQSVIPTYAPGEFRDTEKEMDPSPTISAPPPAEDQLPPTKRYGRSEPAPVETIDPPPAPKLGKGDSGTRRVQSLLPDGIPGSDSDDDESKAG